MSKIERFEDLIAWQKARALTQSVYEVTRQTKFAKDYGLSSQIQRASVSIMSNIAEGFERGVPSISFDCQRLLRRGSLPTLYGHGYRLSL
jgi:hypothetical protein